MPGVKGFYKDKNKKTRPITGKVSKITDFMSKNENSARRRLMQRQQVPLGSAPVMAITKSAKPDEPKVMDAELRRKVRAFEDAQERAKYLPDPFRNDEKSQEELGNPTGIHIPEGILKYIRGIVMNYALSDLKKAIERSTPDSAYELNKFLESRYAFMYGYKGDQILKGVSHVLKDALVEVINQKMNKNSADAQVAELKKKAHEELMQRFREGKITFDDPDFEIAINDTSIRSVEAAKYLRQELKQKFPGVTFSINTKHGTIRVEYADGPKKDVVERVVNKYSKRTDLPEIDLFMGNRHTFTTRLHTPEAKAKALEIFQKRYGPYDPKSKGYLHDRWLYEIENEMELPPGDLKRAK